MRSRHIIALPRMGRKPQSFGMKEMAKITARGGARHGRRAGRGVGGGRLKKNKKRKKINLQNKKKLCILRAGLILESQPSQFISKLLIVWFVVDAVNTESELKYCGVPSSS